MTTVSATYWQEKSTTTDFFQMMRLIDFVFPLEHQRIQLKASHDLQFSPRDIKSLDIQQDEDGGLVQMNVTVAFMGIAGTQGGLPLHYTELLLQQSHHHHHALADFLDLFHHRSIELFYRSWQKHRFFVGYEKAAHSSDTPDLFTRMLLSIAGVSDPKKPLALFHAAHYANPCHSATALSQILSHYFALPIQVLEWQGEWLDLSEDKCTVLNIHNQNNCLGINMIAGKKIWMGQHKIRLQLTLLEKKQLLLFNPKGKAFRQLCETTREFIGPALTFDIQLSVKSTLIPLLQLHKKHPVHLGWDTWFKSKHMPEELNDIVLKEEKCYE